MKRILFVCTGNTCRSPLAEYLLRHKGAESFEVKSAGVAAYNGGLAASHVKDLLQELGIEENHSAQMVTPELMSWADTILTMTTGHRDLLLSHYPEKSDYILTLKEYVYPADMDYMDLDVSDPYGGSLEVYRQTMHELEDLLNKLLQNEGE